MKRAGAGRASLSRPLRRIIAGLVWLGMPAAVQAQADSGGGPRDTLKPGERVRLVMRSSGELVEGEVVWRSRDTLAVHCRAQDGRASNAFVLMHDVVSAQRWAGHHSGHAMARGFGFGLLAGLPIGFLGVQRDEAACRRHQQNNDLCGLAVLGFPIYVVSSGLVGLAVGVHHTTHGWKSVEEKH